jgi:hypothetical protein
VSVARMRATAPACLAIRPVARASALPTPREAIRRTNAPSALAPATRLATARALATIPEPERPAGMAVRAVMATGCVWTLPMLLRAPLAGLVALAEPGEGVDLAAAVGRAARRPAVRVGEGAQVALAATAWVGRRARVVRAAAGPRAPARDPMVAARILSRPTRPAPMAQPLLSHATQPAPMAQPLLSHPTQAAPRTWATRVATAIWARTREVRLGYPGSCSAPLSCCGADASFGDFGTARHPAHSARFAGVLASVASGTTNHTRLQSRDNWRPTFSAWMSPVS